MKLTKKQKNIGIIILILAGIILFGKFNTLSVFQFASASNDVKFLSEDSYSFTYLITATPSRGLFMESPSDEARINAGFGETESSDSIRRAPDFFPSKKYISNNLEIEGLKAVENYQTGNEKTYSDIKIIDPRVECTPLDYSKIQIDSKADIRAQEFSCTAFGDLKAYNEQGQEVSARFYGGTKATTTIVILKPGVECTANQLVNCAENEICDGNNKCVLNSQSNVLVDFYRLSNSQCIPIKLAPSQKTDKDYLTFEECCLKNSICKNDKPSGWILYVVVIFLILLILGLVYILRRIYR